MGMANQLVLNLCMPSPNLDCWVESSPHDPCGMSERLYGKFLSSVLVIKSFLPRFLIFKDCYLEWQSELHDHVVKDVPLLLHVQRTPQVVHQLLSLLLLTFIVKLSFFTPDDSHFAWKPPLKISLSGDILYLFST